MKPAIFAAMAGALALSACNQGDDNTFSPSEEEKGDKQAEDDSEPRGAAAAAARLAQSREEAGERKAAAEDEKGARAFIDGLFAPYANDEFTDVFGKPSTIFDPQLAKAIDKIRQIETDTGEMFLGADPICGCQDFGQFSHTINALTIDGDRATAKLSVRNFGQANPRTIDLVKTPAGWRVYDLGGGFRKEALEFAAGS